MMLKQVVKRLIPLTVWNTLREIYGIPQVIMAKHEQSRRFRKWMSRERSHDKVRIETKLAFDIHRLEKGLVVPEKLRKCGSARPWRGDQFASMSLSLSRDMSR